MLDRMLELRARHLAALHLDTAITLPVGVEGYVLGQASPGRASARLTGWMRVCSASWSSSGSCWTRQAMPSRQGLKRLISQQPLLLDDTMLADLDIRAVRQRRHGPGVALDVDITDRNAQAARDPPIWRA